MEANDRSSQPDDAGDGRQVPPDRQPGQTGRERPPVKPGDSVHLRTLSLDQGAHYASLVGASMEALAEYRAAVTLFGQVEQRVKSQASRELWAQIEQLIETRALLH